LEPVSFIVVNDSYKRWFDLSVLVLSHLLFLPLWVLLWTVIPLLIWLEDRGPVFYQQQRMGKDRRPFNIVKFRTMVIDAEELGPAWTMENDPRITRVGRILRRTAIDELPEILSIWQGKMSFVGPRALHWDEQIYLEELVPGFEQRLQIRPGLTGLAQVYDKTDDPNEKYRYDMDYLKKLGPLLDVRLLLISVRNTLIARWDRRSGKTNMTDPKTGQSEMTIDCQESPESSISNKNNR
jgi:lipopolysaccharide/colanic/teichoic acid biosynthesis glycosyltransferase